MLVPHWIEIVKVTSCYYEKNYPFINNTEFTDGTAYCRIVSDAKWDSCVVVLSYILRHAKIVIRRSCALGLKLT
jgi:hypothetical protein